uniref:Acyl-[acyl-carrier-protein] hydrolase n=1 Tax=Polytomella parva TaxID=51329 RepID=A0A7S0UJQ0_9CHLO|mmetsp:Transcript_11734/g.21084  ORF Transcript_11734/g.21084 Transcript_11734/m.21084 type:complete len:430 (+) Transcript_11734:89-1378(+)
MSISFSVGRPFASSDHCRKQVKNVSHSIKSLSLNLVKPFHFVKAPIENLSCRKRSSNSLGISMKCHATASKNHATTSKASNSVEEDLSVAMKELPPIDAGRFSDDLKSFYVQFQIRGYEVRPDQKTSIGTIANLLQETAGNHAVATWGRTDSGFASLPDMRDLIFVMTRLQIRMYQFPKWGDVVMVRTFFTEEGRLSVRREWEIVDVATGRVIGAATSTWVMINIATRRLSRLPDTVRSKYMRLCPSSSYFCVPPKETKLRLPDFPLPGKLQAPVQVARRSDMDMNGHINNVTYLSWTIESIPEAIYDNHVLYEIEVDFKAECLAGNTVEIHCNPLDGSATSQVVIPDLATLLARGHNGTPWVPGSAKPIKSAGNEYEKGNGKVAYDGPIKYEAPLQFLHSVIRHDGGQELVRARTTWVDPKQAQRMNA